MANVTAQAVIEASRDAHPSYNRVAHPDKILGRYLTRYQQRLLSQIAQLKPDAIVARFEFDVAIHDFEFGEELPAHILIHGGDVTYRTGEQPSTPLTIVGFEQRLGSYRIPTAYRDRTHIYLSGQASDWTMYDVVSIRYFPQGAEITELTQELDLPGQALDVCAARLAYFMGSKTKDATPPIDINQLLGEANACESLFIDEITGRKLVSVNHHPVERW